MAESAKDKKIRLAQEQREAEAAEVMAAAGGTSPEDPEGEQTGPDGGQDAFDGVLGGPEDPVADDSEYYATEALEGDDEDASEPEDAPEGFPPEDPEIVSTPEDFEVASVETLRAPSGHNILAGETPVSYRAVIEFIPSRAGMKKNPETGTKDINRIEVFFNDPHVFYWLYNRIAKGIPDSLHPDIHRAEAVALEEGSVVVWKDKNPKERA